jgi:hypothetical protein
MPVLSFMPRCWLFLLGMVLGGAALAAPEVPKPANALPTSLSFTSVFTNYQGYTDQAVQSWPEANALVGQVGGWRTYAREAMTKQTSSATPALDAHRVEGKP